MFVIRFDSYYVLKCYVLVSSVRPLVLPPEKLKFAATKNTWFGKFRTRGLSQKKMQSRGSSEEEEHIHAFGMT